MTMEEIADKSTETARELRIGLYDILGMVNGLGRSDRERIAPHIEALLKSTEGMPTAFHVVQARGGVNVGQR